MMEQGCAVNQDTHIFICKSDNFIGNLSLIFMYVVCSMCVTGVILSHSSQCWLTETHGNAFLICDDYY